MITSDNSKLCMNTMDSSKLCMNTSSNGRNMSPFNTMSPSNFTAMNGTSFNIFDYDGDKKDVNSSIINGVDKVSSFAEPMLTQSSITSNLNGAPKAVQISTSCNLLQKSWDPEDHFFKNPIKIKDSSPNFDGLVNCSARRRNTKSERLPNESREEHENRIRKEREGGSKRRERQKPSFNGCIDLGGDSEYSEYELG